jgi:AcrR family transcriptional regulator
VKTVRHSARDGRASGLAAEREEQRAVEVPGDRREQIMALAAEMFFTRGYEATTTRDIGAALGIKSASIYYYFPEKEQILFEIIESVLGQLQAGVEEVAMGEATPELRLAAVVVNHVVLHAARPTETTLGDSELRSLNDERYEVSVRRRDAYQGLVVRILEGGADAGRFDLVDAKLTAYAIIAQSSHVGTWFRKSGRLSLSRVVEVHAELALRMVDAEPVPQKEIRRLVRAMRSFHTSATDAASSPP